MIFLWHMRKYIAELLLNKTLATDKAALLGKFKCLKSYKEHFYEVFVMYKYYSKYSVSWQRHSNAHDCELYRATIGFMYFLILTGSETSV